jgi:exosome complex RNA-binding protein Rrp4
MTARYVRFRVQSGSYDGTAVSSDTASAFYIDNSILIRFDVVAREESGSVTTTAHVDGTSTAYYGLVELTRKYAKVKSIQLTIVAASNFYIPTYEDVVIGHEEDPNSFKVIVIDSGNLQVNNQEVSYLFKGV